MSDRLDQALSRIPRGQFVLTAAYNGSRCGLLVDRVQCCSTEPPLVVAAVARCLPVVSLIRDSRSFALCQLSETDRFLARKFSAAPRDGEDPFDSLCTMSAPSGSPIVSRAMSWLDCELVRRVELESDFSLHVGRVRDGGILNDGEPIVVVD